MPQGVIALRLSTSGSGWFMEADDGPRQVFCGDVDEFVTSLLRSSPKRYFGLTVSSVIPGLCLGPALNLAVDSIVSRHKHGEDGKTLVRTDERIAIVSRSHALRDYLAESTLRFGNAKFPFMSFRTFRLKRNGEEQPAKFGRSEARTTIKPLTASPQFLFYDLSPMHATDAVPTCAVVLAEIAEADGPVYIERLMKFAGACHSRFVFPIISYQDVEKCRLLESMGFTVVAVTKGNGTKAPDFTFSALESA
ncbi:MAG TPA: hypothetical protein VN909_08630, partial [Candidatus Dormibacteraeota bacterium]|nr:hypothetical protein [Candidatus Dormibacteraeota bacterium]